jgi:hypothetical protein
MLFDNPTYPYPSPYKERELVKKWVIFSYPTPIPYEERDREEVGNLA